MSVPCNRGFRVRRRQTTTHRAPHQTSSSCPRLFRSSYQFCIAASAGYHTFLYRRKFRNCDPSLSTTDIPILHIPLSPLGVFRDISKAVLALQPPKHTISNGSVRWTNCLHRLVTMSSSPSPGPLPSPCVGPDFQARGERPSATLSVSVGFDNVKVLPQTPQLIALLSYVYSSFI